jgi:hypothetical protein
MYGPALMESPEMCSRPARAGPQEIPRPVRVLHNRVTTGPLEPPFQRSTERPIRHTLPFSGALPSSQMG